MDTFDCGRAAPLIPAWADGELSEAQSAPLREHLIDCRDCRGSMQELRSLSRWFAAGDAAALVPPGFAARVARRAFAGDTGERGSVAPGERVGERRTLDFVLGLTALAAAAVIALALGLRARDLPSGENLHADDRTRLTTDEILERLDDLELPVAQPGEATPAEGERQP